MTRDETRLSVAICWRPIPARIGEEHPVTRLLQSHCRHVVQTNDKPLDAGAFDVVLMLENSRWFPTILAEMEAMKDDAQRPILAVWHWEPLPLPKAAGLAPPSLSIRELAKTVLRDVRATDLYSNLADLKRLSRNGWPDLLIVSSQAWQESLADNGITAHWVPYGYEIGDGAPIAGNRDIEALFLGALDVPRRQRIAKQLRRRGVDLVTRGSWFDKALWGEDRAHLINRAEAFINIQRYPGEISAHRLILGMANKSLVISEPIYRPAPFIPGKHYVEADVGEMPEALNYYRTHSEERNSIADHAHRFVTEELTMEASVSQILALIAEIHMPERDANRCVT
jgi:hypothetical protein